MTGPNLWGVSCQVVGLTVGEPCPDCGHAAGVHRYSWRRPRWVCDVCALLDEMRKEMRSRELEGM